MISFIIITWNSEKHIEECILSAINKCKKENKGYEVIVVDNNSQDKTKKIIKNLKQKSSGKVSLILLNKNLGTTKTRNIAIKKSKGDIICFLDSDAVLKKGSLRLLFEKLRLKDTGIIAPKILFSDGRVQKSVKRFPTILNKLLKIKKIISGIEPKHNEYYSKMPLEEGRVDSAISACWFLRKETIGQVGLFDEKIFYSPEDLDYCLRMWRSKRSVLYYPFFDVMHYTQQLTYKKPLNYISLTHIRDLIYYFLKHRYFFKAPVFGDHEQDY